MLGARNECVMFHLSCIICQSFNDWSLPPCDHDGFTMLKQIPGSFATLASAACLNGGPFRVFNVLFAPLSVAPLMVPMPDPYLLPLPLPLKFTSPFAFQLP